MILIGIVYWPWWLYSNMRDFTRREAIAWRPGPWIAGWVAVAILGVLEFLMSAFAARHATSALEIQNTAASAASTQFTLFVILVVLQWAFTARMTKELNKFSQATLRSRRISPWLPAAFNGALLLGGVGLGLPLALLVLAAWAIFAVAWVVQSQGVLNQYWALAHRERVQPLPPEPPPATATV